MRSKKLNCGALIMLAVVTAATTLTVTFYVTAQGYNDKLAHLYELELEYGELKELADIIDKNFIAEYDAEQALEYALNGCTTEPEAVRPCPGVRLSI